MQLCPSCPRYGFAVFRMAHLMCFFAALLSTCDVVKSCIVYYILFIFFSLLLPIATSRLINFCRLKHEVTENRKGCHKYRRTFGMDFPRTLGYLERGTNCWVLVLISICGFCSACTYLGLYHPSSCFIHNIVIRLYISEGHNVPSRTYTVQCDF